jgi:hypothetical protein
VTSTLGTEAAISRSRVRCTLTTKLANEPGDSTRVSAANSWIRLGRMLVPQHSRLIGPGELAARSMGGV